MRAYTFVPLALVLSAALFTTSRDVHATGVEPGKATPLQREQAQQRFAKGKELFGKKQWDEALGEFRASMDIVESPNTRLYEARTLREMGRLVEAYAELGRTAVEAQELAPQDPRYTKTGESATVERDDLAKKLGFVTVTVEHPTADTKVRIGGEEIRRAGWGEPAPVMPGETQVTVETPGVTPVTKTLSVAAGGHEAITIDATGGDQATTSATTTNASSNASSSDRSSLRPYAYVALGVGAVGLVTFVVEGLRANSKWSDLQSACGSKPCPASKADDVSSGKSTQTIANVGLAFAVVGAAAGVTLYVLSAPKSSTTVGISPTGVVVSGAF